MRLIATTLQATLVTFVTAGIFGLPATMGMLRAPLEHGTLLEVAPVQASFVPDLSALMEAEDEAEDDAEEEAEDDVGDADAPAEEAGGSGVASRAGEDAAGDGAPVAPARNGKLRAPGRKMARATGGKLKRPTQRSKRRCAEETDGIQQLDHGWAVERKLVDHYATHIKDLMSLGWAKRNSDVHGKANGFKIGGIKCGTPLDQSGFRNGDVVHRVNGRKVNSIPQAIVVYGKVRKKDRVEVELTRRGKPVTLVYELK